MVLVDRAVSVCTACVREVSSDASFEKTFTTLARKLSVMFPARFVPANHAFYFVGMFAFIFSDVAGIVGASVGVGS